MASEARHRFGCNSVIKYQRNPKRRRRCALPALQLGGQRPPLNDKDILAKTIKHNFHLPELQLSITQVAGKVSGMRRVEFTGRRARRLCEEGLRPQQLPDA